MNSVNAGWQVFFVWLCLLIGNIVYAFIRKSASGNDEVPANISSALERSYFQGIAIAITYFVMT